jgi:multidrug efflux pump subunit AcrB
MLRIPVSQFPDIVPPQVQVVARYPGASAAVVEATVAQPIESAVNGVDRMIYMRSNSGNDGSYQLNVSFGLGTNADIATVNVNNRVQAALARLPEEVQRGGVTVRKQSSAVLQFLFLTSPDGSRDPLFLSNYATINVVDALARVPASGQASAVRRHGAIHARLVRGGPADQPEPDPADVIGPSRRRTSRPRSGASARGRSRDTSSSSSTS